MNGRLLRSRTERMIGGVAGGMGRYWSVDPTWVRIAWVVLALATNGAAVLVYLLLLVVIPEETKADAATAAAASVPGPGENAGERPVTARAGSPIDSGQGALIIGGVLIVVGAWALIGQYVDLDWSRIWPVGLVVAGLLIVLASFTRRG